MQKENNDNLSIDLNIYISKKSDVSFTTAGDELVLINVTESTLYTLNEIGALIWNMSDGSKNLAEMIDEICPEYEVAREDLERDSKELVKDMLDEKLITLSKKPIE